MVLQRRQLALNELRQKKKEMAVEAARQRVKDNVRMSPSHIEIVILLGRIITTPLATCWRTFHIF
jgi:hypothetical protein